MSTTPLVAAATALLLLPLARAQRLNPPDVHPFGGSEVAVIDADGDGFGDLLFLDGLRLGLAFNAGDGTFLPPIEAQLPFGQRLAILDVNGDGMRDVLVVSHSAALGVVFLNQGGGYFDTGPTFSLLPLPLGSDTRIHQADLNGDGRADFLHGTTSYLSLGDGRFTPRAEPLLAAGGVDLVQDIDGDGLPDVLSLDISNSLPIRIAYGSPAGFADPVILAHPSERSVTPIVADVDGDGWADVIAGGAVGVSVAYGDAPRGFEPFTIYPAPRPSGSVAAADFDRDGLIDLALGYRGAPTRIFRNLGQRFLLPAPGHAQPLGQAEHLRALDLDEDGYVDLVGGEGDSLIVLAGRGNFLFEVEAWIGWPLEHLEFDDLDRDGDLDVLSGGRLMGESTQVFSNRLDPALLSYGFGTPGSGGFVPHLSASGGVARMGNQGFWVRLDQVLGQSPGCLLIAAQPGAFSLPMGWLLVTPPFLLEWSFLSWGTPLAPGGGWMQFPLPVRCHLATAGADVFLQALVLDPGALGQVAFSQGLRVRVIP